VQIEDYDRAKSLKREIELLRQTITAKLKPHMDIATANSQVRPKGGGIDSHDEVR